MIDEINIAISEFYVNEISYAIEYLDYLTLRKENHERNKNMLQEALRSSLNLHLTIVTTKPEYEMSLEELSLIYSNPYSIILENCINYLRKCGCIKALVKIELIIFHNVGNFQEKWKLQKHQETHCKNKFE